MTVTGGEMNMNSYNKSFRMSEPNPKTPKPQNPLSQIIGYGLIKVFVLRV